MFCFILFSTAQPYVMQQAVSAVNGFFSAALFHCILLYTGVFQL